MIIFNHLFDTPQIIFNRIATNENTTFQIIQIQFPRIEKQFLDNPNTSFLRCLWDNVVTLAQMLNVSDRTIRSDIESINTEYQREIIFSNKRLGYKLDEHARILYLSEWSYLKHSTSVPRYFQLSNPPCHSEYQLGPFAQI